MSERYSNATKDTWRGWAWNQLEQRIPRGSLVVVLAGDCAGDIQHAEKRGFRVLGVDTDPKCVLAFRRAGGVAIQADAVFVARAINPDAVIADMLGGMTNPSLRVLHYLRNISAIVWNGLRGRDPQGGRLVKQIENNDPEDSLYSKHVPSCTKKRGKKRLTREATGNHRGKLICGAVICMEWENFVNGGGPHDPSWGKEYVPDWFVTLQGERMRPEYSTYRSKDGSQYFDSVAMTYDCPPPGILIKSGPLKNHMFYCDRQTPPWDPPMELKRKIAAAKAMLTKKYGSAKRIGQTCRTDALT